MKKIVLGLIVISQFILLSSNVFAGTYGGGSGGPTDPYIIADADDMQEIGVNSDDWDKHFLMTADIDLAVYTGTVFNIIGNTTTRFTGVFDGNGYTINNFTYTSTDTRYIGLFGYIDTGGKVMNLGLVNVNIDAGSDVVFLGGLCGANGEGSIINCYSTGSVTGGIDSKRLGGLCGSNFDGSISNSYSSCIVAGGDNSEYVGGLCGWSDQGSIINCYSMGNVTGGTESKYLGGLCGSNSYGEINECYSSVDLISGDNSYCIGGLCGYNDRGKIIKSYSIGSVTGARDLSSIGGFCGYNSGGSIIHCYSTGRVTFGTDSQRYGGFCGRGGGSYIGSFWDIDVNPSLNDSGSGDLENVEGKTTLQMRTEGTFTSLGWDFAGEIANGTNEIWQIPPDSYPLLSKLSGYEPLELAGKGTQDNPYLISDPNELGAIYHYPNNAYYLMTSDIDLAGITWRAAPIAFFNGSFDGGGHVINNLTIDDSGVDNECLGLFGKIGQGGKVKDLGLENISLTGKGRLGALCGINENGSITDCFATGSVTGNGPLGGLCGYNDSGSITDCYSTVNVTGGGSLGGLCGSNLSGSISDCYSTGNVTGGGTDLGGLCGYNKYGSIIDCFASGNVTGDSYLGGLCGYNRGGNIIYCSSSGNVAGKLNSDNLGGLCGYNRDGNISNCSSSGNVIGERNSRSFGGLCGYSIGGDIGYSYSSGNVTVGNDSDYLGGLCGSHFNGSISNCYSISNVSGGIKSKTLGGLCGETNSSIMYCYSAGEVTGEAGSEKIGGFCGTNYSGVYTGCFWDSDINPSLADCGYDNFTRTTNFDLPNVEGKTTLLMQTESTFVDAGWDFVGETVNGIEDIWFIPQGDYPHLWWEGMEVYMELTPRTLNCRSRGNWVKAHLTLPEEFTVADVDSDRPAILHSFGIESAVLYVFVNKDELVEIEAAFEREAVCSLVGDWPEVLNVAGFLTNGDVFLGTSTVRIITPGLKEVVELASHWLQEDCVYPDWCDDTDLSRDSVVNFLDYPLILNSQVEFIPE